MQFKASVQYNDFVGTAAADNADQRDLSRYLRSIKAINVSEQIIGIELCIGENHNGDVKAPHIRAYVVNAPDFETTRKVISQDPIPVREIEVEMSLEEFLGCFKRFAVTLTRNGLEIDGRAYKVEDS